MKTVFQLLDFLKGKVGIALNGGERLTPTNSQSSLAVPAREHPSQVLNLNYDLEARSQALDGGGWTQLIIVSPLGQPSGLLKEL